MQRFLRFHPDWHLQPFGCLDNRHRFRPCSLVFLPFLSYLSHPLNKQTWSSVFFFSSPSVSFSWHDVRSPLLESMTKGCDLRMLQIRMKSDTQMSSLLSLMRRREEKSEINSFPSGLQSSCCFLLFLFFFLSSIHFREEKTNMCMILPLPDLLPLSWRNVTKNTRSEEKPYDEREKRLLIPPASLPSDKSPFPDLSIRGGRKLILQWFPAQQKERDDSNVERRFWWCHPDSVLHSMRERK